MINLSEVDPATLYDVRVYHFSQADETELSDKSMKVLDVVTDPKNQGPLANELMGRIEKGYLSTRSEETAYEILFD